MNRDPRRGRIAAAALALCVGMAMPSKQARAWDPSTTHQGLLEAAVVRSALHLRWMDASELERGLFSELRVDPDRLEREELRVLQMAMRQAHADVGARPLGGPGACPSADAPPSTQLYCVDQDLWEQSALGWLRLGMLAEVTPSARLTHHFLDRDEPEALRWSDRELPPRVLRVRQARSNGEPIAGVVTGTNFAGGSPSALAWLEDPDDPLAPPRTFQHLQLASTSASRVEREHHLALGLIGLGALLHLVQDLSVPAHARGDATAFFAPLSPALGDRGLPLQEFARVEYGRAELPGVAPGVPGSTPAGVPLAPTLAAHLIGDGVGDGVEHDEGLAVLAARHYFSESSVPPPAYLDDSLDPAEAARALLGEDHQLDPVEVEGAVLSPWPAGRGYLLSPTGRALAAFDTDLEGRIRPYLDEICYRDQLATLIPATVDATRSILDLIWPAWPEMRTQGDALELSVPAWDAAELIVYLEDAQGERREHERHSLVVDADNLVELPPVGARADGEPDEGARVVLVLLASRGAGPPIVLEHTLSELPPPPEVPEPAPITPQPFGR